MLRSWTPDNLAAMREKYPCTPTKVLAAEFGKTVAAVCTKARVMGLCKVGDLAKKKWTPQDDGFMLRFYGNKNLVCLTSLFGCSEKAIYMRALILGLSRDKEIVAEARRKWMRENEDKLLASRFKKGLVPANKGKKQADYCTPEAIAKTTATRFKKGNVPHQHREVGAVRHQADGTVMIKVADNKNRNDWMIKSRMVWIENFGPIPEGRIIEFIDNDCTNFSPDNLRCVTRRENIINNGQKDSAIAKRFLGAKTSDDVDFLVQTVPAVIELKRTLMKVNGQLKRNAGTPAKPKR